MTSVPLTNLIEQVVLDQMRFKTSFTALDISNQLKGDRYPVTHREVSAAVREIYASGAMAYFDYERKVIPVVTEAGAKQTQAFLYHFHQVRPRTYQTRQQDALPPVPTDAARDLADCLPASPLLLLPRLPRTQAQTRRSTTRRDGALSIPRHLLLALGWPDGQKLSLTVTNGQLELQPAEGNSADLHVWSGSRLRVCRTKLRAGALTAESVTVRIEGNGVRLNEVRLNEVRLQVTATKEGT